MLPVVQEKELEQLVGMAQKAMQPAEGLAHLMEELRIGITHIGGINKN